LIDSTTKNVKIFEYVSKLIYDLRRLQKILTKLEYNNWNQELKLWAGKQTQVTLYSVIIKIAKRLVLHSEIRTSESWGNKCVIHVVALLGNQGVMKFRVEEMASRYGDIRKCNGKLVADTR